MYKFKITDEPFARGYLECSENSIHLRTGHAFIHAAKEMELSLFEEIGLPDASFKNMAATYHFSTGESVNEDLIKEKITNAPEFSADYTYIREEFLKHSPMQLLWNSFTELERDVIDSFGGWGGTWGGHSVPNLIDFAKHGTNALREKVHTYREKNPAAADLYDGILLTLDAIDILGARFHSLALDTASHTDGKAKGKLLRLADTFSRCPKLPAGTFMDACAVYVMLFTLDGIDSPGRFDQYMIEFWERTDPSAAQEMLDDLWEFFLLTRTWNVCVGGSDENWNDKSNALSYAILETAKRSGCNTPNLTFRWHRNTPEKLMRLAAETIATGIGLPALYNDEAVCPALESLGIPASDAHEYVMNGCNQIDIQGKSHMGLEDGEVNLGMAVELTFFNGLCQKTGKKFGIETGAIETLDTYEKFLAAVKAQVHNLCDMVCAMANKSQRIFAEHTANPLRTLTIEGCLQKGRDYKNSGPLYGHGQILAEGVPEIIDSLAAVKKYVFEEKRFTLSELRDALAANFEGFDAVYQTLRRSDLHFGNDDPYVDSIAADIINDYNRYLRTIKTERGGVYSGGCSPFVRAADNGGAVGALPNGKRADEDLYGDSIGATPGRDTNGPTALLSSCLNIDQTLPCSGFILNVKFDKSMLQTERGLNGFLALWHTYFENRGQQLSVTVVSREELLDAVEHPENHRDLIVRVGGFSDYFINLTPQLQKNVLARTDYAV